MQTIAGGIATDTEGSATIVIGISLEIALPHIDPHLKISTRKRKFTGVAVEGA